MQTSSQDNIGGGMEDGERDMLGARDAEEALEERQEEEAEELKASYTSSLRPPQHSLRPHMHDAEEELEERQEEEEEESIEWFGLSTDAEDEPTVFDADGWHRQ